MMSVPLAVVLAPVSAAAEPACGLDLAGTWQLVSIVRQEPNGERDAAPFGKHPTGLLIYSADGPPVCLGSQERVGQMMEDFLAQEELAKRLAGKRD